jgi:hypothetical protein
MNLDLTDEETAALLRELDRRRAGGNPVMNWRVAAPHR